MTIYFDQPCTGTVESHFFGIQKKGRSRFSRCQGHHEHLKWRTLHRVQSKRRSLDKKWKGDPLTLKKEKKNEKNNHNPITLHFIWYTTKHAQGAVKHCFPLRIDMRTPWFSKAKTVKLFPMITWKTNHLEYNSSGERCAGSSRTSFSTWEQGRTVSERWLIKKGKNNRQTHSATFTSHFEYSKTCTGWGQKL